jgi:Flp pilus assembly protein TadD
LSRDRLDEAVRFAERAATLQPGSAKYVHAWAYYVSLRGDRQGAMRILRGAIAGKAASR